MAYRAAKNANGVIMEIGNDEGQSGLTSSGNTWCSFTFDAIPDFTIPAGCSSERPMMFKENATHDGIMVRPDSEVLASPNA